MMCMGQLRTNVELDPVKLERARRITGLKTTKAIVDFALGRLAASNKGLSSLVRLAGKIHFKTGYSYKKSRG